MTIFSDVKESCRWVTAHAEHVAINENKIGDLSDKLPVNGARAKLKENSFDPAREFYHTRQDTIEFVCFLNAANFGSGFRDELRAEGSLPTNMRFYGALMSSLKTYVDAYGVPQASKLADADIDFYSDVFGLPTTKLAARRLLELFRQSYSDYGRFLNENFDGNVVNMFDQADRSAEKFVTTLAQIPSYQDVSLYKGRKVMFYKRAQITAADLFFALQSDDDAFHDITNLTAFADPALPQMLRWLGILEFSPSLKERVAKGEEFAPGSAEEVEIRAATVEAVERIRGYYPFWRVIDIDDILWRMAGITNLDAFPRHKTKTLFY